jgi:2-polyprenyl-3-methyl-5-hydroxy-6-metoxy-1,4-benzoquinol methylase
VHSVAGRALDFALDQLGKPYRWGGSGPASFDCSGLVYRAYERAGLRVSRGTATQVDDGSPVVRADLAPGDLVFPYPGHVQLYLGGGAVIDAPHTGAFIRVSPLRHVWKARRVTDPCTPRVVRVTRSVPRSRLVVALMAAAPHPARHRGEPTMSIDQHAADWSARVFADDYEHFYRESLGPEMNEAEAGFIADAVGLEPGMRILDVPCGWGRIGNQLALMGGSVTGVDSNPRYVSLARGEAASLGVDALYLARDMRDLSYRREFDVVVNWYTSFGYFDDATNRRFLASCAEALNPGGVLVIEILDRDWLVGALGGRETFLSMAERGDDLLIDKVAFDPAAGFSDVGRVTVRDGKVRRDSLRIQRFSQSELADRLRGAGFDQVRFCRRTGSRPASDGQRLIALAHTPAAPA